MRTLMSFLLTIIMLSCMVSVVGWLFATDFLLLDILLVLGWLALWFIVPIVLIIVVIWIILEIFR